MDYFALINYYAKLANVSATLLYAICSHESRGFSLDYAIYDNGSPSYSVCQIKNSTAILMGYKGKPEKLRDARVGIKYAALYLQYQQNRYGNDWVKIVSSYNSGSFNPSERKPGCPRNLRYLRLVQEKLPEKLRYRLNCGK